MNFRPEWYQALVGGALIGLAASLMLLFNGRVMGISGILTRAVSFEDKPNLWRWCVLAGLLLGGVFLRLFFPEALSNTLENSKLMVVCAGGLVGFGAALGSGCTSGHGVCGISRLSFRSLVATGIFILAGAITVTCLRIFGVRP